MIFVQGLRYIFNVLDDIVYWLMATIYNLLVSLAKINIFDSTAGGGENLISEISGRIYALIGIIMLFKVAASLVNYIIDPDKIEDKKKGGAKLIENFVITLALLIAMPLIFREMYKLQSVILEDNVIGRIVLGDTLSDDDYVKDAGNNMAIGLLTSMAQINDKICEVTDKECLEKAASYLSSSDATKFRNSKYYKYFSTDADERIAASKSENITARNVISQDVFNLKIEYDGDEIFLIDYKILLTTIVGAAMAWVILLYCIDVAKRSISLAFLELIAPIPLISRLGGDDETFSKWYHKVINEFLSLFIKLATFFLAVRIIQYLLENIFNIFKSIDGNPLIAFVFICIGTFYFVKDIDKFIGDIFKGMGGGLGFNPIKRSSSLLKGASAIGGFATGAVAGAIVRGKAGYQARKEAGKNKFMTGLGTAKSVLAGSVGGAFAGASAAYKGKGGAFKRAGAVINGINEGTAKSFDHYGESFGTRFRNSIGMKESYPETVRKQNETFKKYKGQISDAQKGRLANENDYVGLVSHSDMRTAIANMVNAKNARNKAQSEYEILKTRSEQGEKIDPKKIDAARVAYAKASSTYDNAKKEYDNFAKIYESDAKAFENYSAGEDRTKYSNFESSENIGESTGINHMEEREGQDWEHDSAFATERNSQPPSSTNNASNPLGGNNDNTLPLGEKQDRYSDDTSTFD